MAVRVRTLTGIWGGVLGLLSLFLPYLRISLLGLEIVAEDFTLFELLNLCGDRETLVFLYIIIGLIVVGSIVAFIHPIGGGIQLFGGLLFGWGISSGGGAFQFPFVNVQFQLGFYLLILASIIALTGFGFKSKDGLSSHVET